MAILLNIAAYLPIKKKVGNKKGTTVLSKALISSVLIVAAAVVIFLIFKTVMCKTGTWSGGVC